MQIGRSMLVEKGTLFCIFLCLTIQGLEYVDGACFMSCVVTNKWSDWSTQAWNSNKLALRIHKIGDDYVVSQERTFLQYMYTFSKP